MKKLRLKKNIYPGKLIVFEGVDGSGKTTMLEQASLYLKSKNIEHIKIKMPSDYVRNYPIFHDYDNSVDNTTRNMIDITSLTVFVSGDRLIHLDSTIIPALKSGKTVLCDRYCYTGYVRCTNKLIRKISNRFIKPDVVFMPTASLTTLKNRVKERKEEKNNYYSEENVKEQVKKFCFLAKKDHFILLDTDKSLDSTVQKMQQELNKLLSSIKH